MKLAFTLPCAPTAQQRPRHTRTPGGFDRTYKSKTQAAREQELDLLLMPHKPPQPLDGAICLAFIAFMPIPKAAPKREKMAMAAGRIPHTKKPDLDNLAKQLKDALTRAGFWHDDRQVAALICHKVYGASPHWQVELEQLND